MAHDHKRFKTGLINQAIPVDGIKTETFSRYADMASLITESASLPDFQVNNGADLVPHFQSHSKFTGGS